MPVVEIALTETRLWAWSANTHTDLTPSVVPSGDGRSLVVGEPLAPPSIAVSPAQLITADRIAYDPGMPTPEEALTAVFGHTLAQLRIPTPCERLTVVHPTEWDPHRLAVLESAARRHSGHVTLETVAVRSVTTGQRIRDVRTVILEFGPLSTTASTVVPTEHGPRLEYCEHEPALAAAEIAAQEDGVLRFDALLERLLHGCRVSSVIVVGRTDAGFLDRIGAAVADRCGGAELLVVAGTDLVRVRRSEPDDHRPSLPPADAETEWLQPLRERAAATRPPRSRTPFYLGAAAVLVVAVLIAAGVGIARISGGDSDATAAAPSTISGPAGGGEATTEAEPDPGPVTFGALRLTIPDGWRVKNPSAAPEQRLELVPDTGLRARIAVAQQPVASDVGYEQIAADLEAQIARRPAGSVSAVRRDVVFAGRPGLAYSEHPEDGSTVDWHVIVEHSIQISIGCQYQTGGQDSITPICEDLANSLDVTP
ncbi:type VII secretion-associated protein [Nocardia jinanensis]|uniref:Type VII secretion-associated protein n=1 Tax=Nocardia jinanensis TaxID=382504 RepID=A0A917VVH3_9NOCA|nr:type VII secretion-associated protein [Nocardia jinanensis]GGL24104.1 type VII secretion-associated protein [Nocardia jinanensis]